MTNILHQIQVYFSAFIAFLVVLQPFAIPLSGALQTGATIADRKHWLKTSNTLRALSKVCGTFAVVDLGRIIRFLGEPSESQALKNARRINDAIIKTFPDVTRTLLVLMALGAALQSTGCMSTFEEARLARPATVGAAQPSPNRCAALSDREYWFDVASYATGATGAGAVLAVIPASEKYDTALLISGASAGAISVVSGFASQHAATAYVREGCGK